MQYKKKRSNFETNFLAYDNGSWYLRKQTRSSIFSTDYLPYFLRTGTMKRRKKIIFKQDFTIHGLVSYNVFQWSEEKRAKGNESAVF